MLDQVTGQGIASEGIWKCTAAILARSDTKSCQFFAALRDQFILFFRGDRCLFVLLISAPEFLFLLNLVNIIYPSLRGTKQSL
jgi:hypothetical protein